MERVRDIPSSPVLAACAVLIRPGPLRYRKPDKVCAELLAGVGHRPGCVAARHSCAPCSLLRLHLSVVFDPRSCFFCVVTPLSMFLTLAGLYDDVCRFSTKCKLCQYLVLHECHLWSLLDHGPRRRDTCGRGSHNWGGAGARVCVPAALRPPWVPVPHSCEVTG